ncbi:type IV pilin [Halomarina rubra]|uniref:Type IV pilin n=1 Tax=Halomarina rubra TaxID=2071873 RepID=A0ABD6B1Z5_9EURY|nr:type IV pilin [Halomarina rubra]
MSPHRNERAVAPVVGVVLVVAIVVLLATAASVMLLGFGDYLQEPSPLVASGESIQVTLEDNQTDHTLRVRHVSGMSVDADALDVLVTSGSASHRYPFPVGNSSALADGTWDAGEQVAVDLNASQVCQGGGDTARVSLVYSTGDSGSLISQQTVPIERGQFLINGSNVQPTTSYTANVTFVGTGWSSPSVDPPVDVSVEVGGATAYQWTDQTDTDETVGSFDVTEQTEGTGLSITAKGAYSFDYDEWDWRYRTISSTENSTHMRVLRDGDDVPQYETDSDQQSVAEYLGPYVEDGEISLQDNQAIFLFDFNTDEPVSSSRVEFQDAVVLVSFFTEHEHVSVHQTVRGENVVVCPAATTGGD